MLKGLLSHINIVDISTRLPGPMGSYILTTLGANVIKIEDTSVGGDPFNQDELQKVAPNFKQWYKNLNSNKTIISLNFKTEKEKLGIYLAKADIILIPDLKKVEDIINEIGIEKKPILKLAAGRGEHQAMHDLNALALTKTFSSHLDDDHFPPYLPLAGITFAQYMATTALALILKSQATDTSISETIYLEDVAPLVLDSLYSEEHAHDKRDLHNGVFPCYGIYPLKDGTFACLAAVEEKFWKRFVEIFDLNLKLEDRFDTTGEVNKLVKGIFKQYGAQEIRDKIAGQNICLTLTHL